MRVASTARHCLRIATDVKHIFLRLHFVLREVLAEFVAQRSARSIATKNRINHGDTEGTEKMKKANSSLQLAAAAGNYRCCGDTLAIISEEEHS
jgi:hypothetical protein